MKVDVFNRQGTYQNWKELVQQEGVEGLLKNNSDLLIQYIFDMERGENVGKGTKKGKRSYAQLNKLRQKLFVIFKRLQERGIKDVTKTTSTQILELFSDMSSGVLKKTDGERYGDLSTDIKCFKAFWHWWMKINRKKEIVILDITEDLNSSPENTPKFVYVTKEEKDKIIPFLDKKEQTIVEFVYDSLIRAPTELSSLQVNNIYEQDGEVWVNIPDEISKVKGRSFNLLFSGKAILEHIKENKLNQNDYLFTFSPIYLNWKLQKIAKQIWGDKVSPKSGELYSKITLYDFRHSGAIHLRVLAKENPSDISLDAIRERGGWKDFKMLNYYTKFIGIDGKIEKQGLLIKKDKVKLQEEVDELRRENQKIKEDVAVKMKRYEENTRKMQMEFILKLQEFTKKYELTDNLKEYVKESIDKVEKIKNK